jgi:hypothetical protein
MLGPTRSTPHRLYSEGNMDDSAANALATIRFYISDVLLTVETRG